MLSHEPSTLSAGCPMQCRLRHPAAGGRRGDQGGLRQCWLHRADHAASPCCRFRAAPALCLPPGGWSPPAGRLRCMQVNGMQAAPCLVLRTCKARAASLRRGSSEAQACTAAAAAAAAAVHAQPLLRLPGRIRCTCLVPATSVCVHAMQLWTLNPTPHAWALPAVADHGAGG